MKEREIKLNDLFIELLVHWRGFILSIMIGGILFCAISYIRSSVTIEEHESEQNIFSVSELEEILRSEQKTAVKNYVMSEEYYQLRLDYLDNAALMRINPDQAPQIEIILGITGAEESNVNFSNVYEELLYSSELDSYVSERVEGISVQDMNELTIVARYGTTSVMEKTRTIRVIINSPDKKTCEGIADALLAYVNDKKPIVERSFGQHEVIVLNRAYVELDNNDIRNAQRTVRSEIISLEETLENNRMSWTDDVIEYYELLTGREFRQDSEREVETDKAQVSWQYRVKYIMIGIVCAAFIYVFCVFMIFVSNKKLRDTDDFSELLQISCLGYIPKKKEKARIFGFVDRWIDSLRHRNQKVLSAEERIHLTAVTVAIAAKKNGANSVCFIGSNLTDNGVAVCRDMEQGLKEKGIQQEFIDNILYDVESMEKLDQVAVAVLVGNVGVTLYSEVVQELQLLKRQEIPVLGLVVIE